VQTEARWLLFTVAAGPRIQPANAARMLQNITVKLVLNFYFNLRNNGRSPPHEQHRSAFATQIVDGIAVLICNVTSKIHPIIKFPLCFIIGVVS